MTHRWRKHFREFIFNAVRTAKSFGLKQKLRNSPTPPVVLFVTSNGAGLGHLTRLFAVSRELKDLDFNFLTLSSGYYKLPLPPEKVSYFPSQRQSGLTATIWNHAFSKNLESHIILRSPIAIVFDGTYLYSAVTSIARRNGLKLIWIQRGCWKEEIDVRSTQRHRAGEFCDAVIIPGDYGCPENIDVGSGIQTLYTQPIIVSPDEPKLDRFAALERLSLDPSKRYVLIQLGAGNINDIRPLQEKAVQEVKKLGSNWVPVLAKNPLAADFTSDPGTVIVSYYPLAEVFSAFDFGVFAAGYNSVQESVALRLPSIFVPNLATRTDDQLRRAQYIAQSGLGFIASDCDSLGLQIRRMVDGDARDALLSELALTEHASGAAQVARFLEQSTDRKAP